MHDIDSTRLETHAEQDEYPAYQEFEDGSQGEDSFEMPMTAEEEEALAAELLGVTNEAEMDQFFGKLFRKLRPAIGGAARFLAQNGGPLVSALKGIAKKALPFVGGALGSAIPIPGVGTALGTALGNVASKLLEMETDELELEDREFEMARRFVRLASHAVRQGTRIPPRYNPRATANLALRRSIHRLRRLRGFRRRPIYQGAVYPSCPPCPVCAQQVPADVTTDTTVEPVPAPAPTPPPVAPQTGEFEFEDANEFEGAEEFEDGQEFEGGPELEGADEFEGDGEFEFEGNDYETDSDSYDAPRRRRRRSGRWIRRGRKIVLYGL
jgi:hypothetical protein